MCGILGQINRNERISVERFQEALYLLKHRGPDDSGIQYFNQGQIALGHRRLSFLDLSEKGHQPMVSSDGLYAISLNGEIYNFLELRETLISKGYVFYSETDTEVLLAAFQEWGIECIHKLNGMFSFALLDLKNKKCFLVRDRFGIKPLYYRIESETLYFASELKSIIALQKQPKEMDKSAFADYFVYRYIPSPKTIWKDSFKIPPAHYLVFDYTSFSYSLHEYWQIPFAQNMISESQLIEETRELLIKSVAFHCRSDVPIGAFLSGGYDSSALVYFQTILKLKPETFSIGFEGWNESEHLYARQVADSLSVKNYSLIVKDKDLDLLDKMPLVYDEPIADISILPTWLISNFAHEKVKAVLSGEGADELFGGYTWQRQFMAENQQLSFFKKAFTNKKENLITFYAKAMAMGSFDFNELKRLSGVHLEREINDDVHWFYKKNIDASLSPLKSIQRLDIKCFMAELVLTKVDRASMNNSLEVRVPFLEHTLFEKVLQSREEVYFKKDKKKFLLYENLKSIFPKEILERPKQGFVGPDLFYMNMNRYKSMLNKSIMVEAGMIRKEYIEKLFLESDHWRLWKLSVMEKWYKHWMS